MTAPNIDVATLTLDSSGIAQAISQFSATMRQFETTVQQASQRAQAASAGVDNMAQAHARANEAASEHTKTVEHHNEVLGRFVEEAKSYAMSFVAFETAKHAIESMIEVVKEAEYTNARLNAMLATVGATAGITAKDIEEMSERISDNSLFDDEAVKKAATVLLSFDYVRGNTFKRAMDDAVELASRWGEDLPSAAMKIGRALESPTAGMMLLSRAGVVFTQQEREQIRVMEEHRQIADFQALILKKLEGTSQNTAKALRNTLGGAFDALKSNIKAATEELQNSDGALQRFINGLALLVKSASASSPLDIAKSRIAMVKLGIANAAAVAGMKPEDMERRLRQGDTSLFENVGGQSAPMTALDYTLFRHELAGILPDEALVKAQPSFTLPGAIVTPKGAKAVGDEGKAVPPPLVLTQAEESALQSLIDSMQEETVTLKGDKNAVDALRLSRAMNTSEIKHATYEEYLHVQALRNHQQMLSAIQDLLKKQTPEAAAGTKYGNLLAFGDMSDPETMQRLSVEWGKMGAEVQKLREAAKTDPSSVQAAQQEIQSLEAKRMELHLVNQEEAQFLTAIPKGTAVQRERVKALQQEVIALQRHKEFLDYAVQAADTEYAEFERRNAALIQAVQGFEQGMERAFGSGLDGKAENFRNFTLMIVDAWRSMIDQIIAKAAAMKAMEGLGNLLGDLGFDTISTAITGALFGGSAGTPLTPQVPIPATPPVGGIIPSSSMVGATAGASQRVIVTAPVHVTVQAIDSASFTDRLDDHAAYIAHATAQQVQRSTQLAAAMRGPRG